VHLKLIKDGNLGHKRKGEKNVKAKILSLICIASKLGNYYKPKVGGKIVYLRKTNTNLKRGQEEPEVFKERRNLWVGESS